MTPKQIDKLRAMHRMALDSGGGWTPQKEDAQFAAFDALPYVLAEREALLAFVKRLSLQYPECALCQESATVIANAEAPSDTSLS